MRVDGAASKLTCDDLTFDGVYNDPAQATDGKLTFSADSDDYLNAVFDRGEYIVTITGTAEGANPV